MNKLPLTILENKNIESLILGDNFEAEKEFGQSQEFYDRNWEHENQLEKVDVSNFKKLKEVKMTQNELTKAIFWQLIAFAKLEENPQIEFSTSPILFEFAKTQGIKNTISVFKTLEKYNFLSTESPTFQTISLTQKAISLEKKENIEKMIRENNQLANMAIQKSNSDFAEKLKLENEFLETLIN